jgi:RNA polymerase sigma-70 factor (ECF subfamily)
MKGRKNTEATLAGYSDNELMKLVAEADQKAFTQLYNRWAGRIRFFFLRLYSFDADMANDRTQDTFLRLLENAAGFDLNQRFSPWLYAIANNLYKNDLRRRELETVFRESKQNSIPSEMPNTERCIDLKYSEAFVDKMLNTLDPEVKAIFILRHAEELSIPEIAHATGCAEGTVKSRLFYAMKKLSQNLQTHHISEWI